MKGNSKFGCIFRRFQELGLRLQQGEIAWSSSPATAADDVEATPTIVAQMGLEPLLEAMINSLARKLSQSYINLAPLVILCGVDFLTRLWLSKQLCQGCERGQLFALGNQSKMTCMHHRLTAVHHVGGVTLERGFDSGETCLGSDLAARTNL